MENIAIKYPSNWVAGKYPQSEDAPNTIDNYFYYAGKGASFALVQLRTEDSVLSNVSDRPFAYGDRQIKY